MIKREKVTCEKCKEIFIIEAESSTIDKVLEKGHYICITCEEKEDEMETTINIKLDEEQVEDIVKKVTENIMKEAKDNFYELSDTGREEPKKKYSVMYLEARISGYYSEVQKVYFGREFNTLEKELATDFDLSDDDRKKANELKKQGWKEEVVYK